MKKIFLPITVIYCLLFAQYAFSATFTNNRFTPPSSSSQFSNANNERLREEFAEYSPTMKQELERLKRDPSSRSLFLGEEDMLADDYAQKKSKKSKKIKNKNIQNDTNAGSSNLSPEIQQVTPSWWRQENSFEGWKFD